LICDKLGRPSDAELDFVTSERAKRFMMSLPNKAATPMAELFPAHKGETEALDLLTKMLEFHPRKRITIQQALEHPFLLSLHNPEDEPVANFTFSFEFENDELPREKVQELIWEQVRAYHPYLPENYPSAVPRRKVKQMLSSNGDAKQQPQPQHAAEGKSELDDEKKDHSSSHDHDHEAKPQEKAQEKASRK
jgi:serine/threonine protein kinase